jgi:hypothetical protein
MRGYRIMFTVMPGLVPGIHVLPIAHRRRKTWMAGTSPAMTQNSINLVGH